MPACGGVAEKEPEDTTLSTTVGTLQGPVQDRAENIELGQVGQGGMGVSHPAALC